MYTEEELNKMSTDELEIITPTYIEKEYNPECQCNRKLNPKKIGYTREVSASSRIDCHERKVRQYSIYYTPFGSYSHWKYPPQILGDTFARKANLKEALVYIILQLQEMGLLA